MEPTERRSRAGEEATEWWLRLQEREMPREQREELVDWLRESAVHVAELLRVASVHGALEQFEQWTRIATDGFDDEAAVVALRAHCTAHVPTKSRSPLIWSMAAVVTCVVVAATLLVSSLRGQTIHTERGERREVALADGSVVQIDPESRLRFRFEDDARRVFLDAGRALFHVAKNPKRPFLVQVDATTVRAVGTAFAVERAQQGVVVTVAEGKVAVEDTARRAPSAPEALPRSAAPTRASPIERQRQRDERVFLTANQQVTIRAAGPAASIREVDSARALAWAEGRLIFDNTSVAEVVAQFNRYNTIQLRVEDEQLARRPISGVFNAANPESFIDFIQAATAVRVDRQHAGDISIATDR
jgi:transmembrane sensor